MKEDWEREEGEVSNLQECSHRERAPARTNLDGGTTRDALDQSSNPSPNIAAPDSLSHTFPFPSFSSFPRVCRWYLRIAGLPVGEAAVG